MHGLLDYEQDGKRDGDDTKTLMFQSVCLSLKDRNRIHLDEPRSAWVSLVNHSCKIQTEKEKKNPLP